MAKPTKSEAELKQDFDAFVEQALPTAKLVALSELQGGNYLLKKEYKLNSQGDIVSEKYVPIPWENKEEILTAINHLLSNETHELGDEYYMLSQRPPSHRFWESLLARTIGKPIEQVKSEVNINNYSETLQRAKEMYAQKDENGISVANWFKSTKQ